MPGSWAALSAIPLQQRVLRHAAERFVRDVPCVGCEFRCPQLHSTCRNVPQGHTAGNLRAFLQGICVGWDLLEGQAALCSRITCKASLQQSWSTSHGSSSTALFTHCNCTLKMLKSTYMDFTTFVSKQGHWLGIAGAAPKHNYFCGQHKQSWDVHH